MLAVNICVVLTILLLANSCVLLNSEDLYDLNEEKDEEVFNVCSSSFSLLVVFFDTC